MYLYAPQLLPWVFIASLMLVACTSVCLARWTVKRLLIFFFTIATLLSVNVALYKLLAELYTPV